MHHQTGGAASLINTARRGGALRRRQLGSSGPSNTGVAVPKTGRSSARSLNIPLYQNQAGCCSTGREKKVLHLHVPNIAGVPDFEQDFRVAKARCQQGEEQD